MNPSKVAVNHVSAPDKTTAVDADLERHIAAFRRGDWFYLTTGDRTDRVQLRWLSPRRAICLFAAAQDEKIYSLKPARYVP